MASEDSLAFPRGDWPTGCRYYDPLTMDAVQISTLLTEDTMYADSGGHWHLEYLFVSEDQVYRHQTAMGDSHDEGIFSQQVAEAPMVIIYVRQTRKYLSHDTASSLWVDKPTWMALLNRTEVLPSFVELLHSNNGETLQVSQPGFNLKEGSDVSSASDMQEPEVFHVGYKLSTWQFNEAAVYARRDLTTGRSFVLVLGTPSSVDLSRLERLLQSSPTANIFHIVHAVHATNYNLVEQTRWEADYRVQDLEDQTGIGTLSHPNVGPIKLEQLEFNRDLKFTEVMLRDIAWGSTRLLLDLKSMQSHLTRYEKATENSSICRMSVPVLRNLQSACEMKLELAQRQYEQIHELRARVIVQLEVATALMAQRDTQLNIEIAQATRHDTELNVEIAKAAKRDSELMRGIAVVTMIFLPATFVATFFSVVFFHVGSERSVDLTVDQNIWWYPTVTLPLTLAIATWYVPWSMKWSWTAVLNPSLERRASKSKLENGDPADNMVRTDTKVENV